MIKIALLKTGILLTSDLMFNNNINAQTFQNLDKAPHDITYLRENRVSKPLIKVVYGRPQKNGQEVIWESS